MDREAAMGALERALALGAGVEVGLLDAGARAGAPGRRLGSPPCPQRRCRRAPGEPARSPSGSPRSLVWQTEIQVLPQGRILERREDHLVVRSPRNPLHHWGNFLLFDEPPEAGDGERWEALFRAEFGDTQHPPGLRVGPGRRRARPGTPGVRGPCLCAAAARRPARAGRRRSSPPTAEPRGHRRGARSTPRRRARSVEAGAGYLGGLGGAEPRGGARQAVLRPPGVWTS